MALLLGCVAAIVLGVAGVWRPIGEGLRQITLPMVRASASLGQRIGLSKGPHTNEITPERFQTLEQRASRLAVDYIRLHTLEEENRALRTQAHFLETSGYDSVGARVITRQFSEGRARFVIDRGRHDHVEIGQAVVTDEGIFIGKISALHEQVATVDLLTDPESRTAAMRLGAKHLMGVVEGRGNGAAMLTYIPSSESLERDQVVVTAGTEEKVPAHLPIGIINAVEGKPTDPFWNAAIEPLIPLDRVGFVSILRPTVLRP